MAVEILGITFRRRCSLSSIFLGSSDWKILDQIGLLENDTHLFGRKGNINQSCSLQSPGILHVLIQNADENIASSGKASKRFPMGRGHGQEGSFG